jgi:hypothetical protein
VTATLNVEVAYIGNKGTHVFAGNGPAYNTNEPAIGSGTQVVICHDPTTGLPINPCTATFRPSIPQANRRRLFLNGVPAFTYTGQFAGLTCCSEDVGNYFGNDASNHYNALQVKVEKRFSHGLQLLSHYTFSHAYNFDSNYYSVNPKIAYGPDDYNRNHVWVNNLVYELPVGKGKKFFTDAGRWKNYLVGGWQVSSTTNWSGGLPFTPTLGECGNISDVHISDDDCRPNLLPGQSLKTGLHRDASGNLTWFTPVAPLVYPVNLANPTGNNPLEGTDLCTLPRPTAGPFALPACGQIGNIGRNSYRGPHFFGSDLSLTKAFNITETVIARFRFDAYNLFNHPVLGFNSAQGNLSVDNGAGGRITAIETDASPNAPNGLRQLQFGVRLDF